MLFLDVSASRGKTTDYKRQKRWKRSDDTRGRMREIVEGAANCRPPLAPRDSSLSVQPLGPLREVGPPAGGKAESAGKVPREMALVGEPGRRGDLRQRCAGGDHGLGADQPAADLETVR